jgi:small basic protein
MITRIFELVMLVKIWIAVVCFVALCILVGGYRLVSEEHNVSVFTVNIVVAVCLVILGLNIGKFTTR